MRPARCGQALLTFALLLPLVLLPVAGYAVQAALLSDRDALLQAAVARAAEDAAQVVDVGALRGGGVLRLDRGAAAAVAQASLEGDDPHAGLRRVVVGAVTVSVTAEDREPRSFGGLLRAGAVTLRAAATARLAAGYESPSSRLALPCRSLSMTGCGIFSLASSSRHRLGWMKG